MDAAQDTVITEHKHNNLLQQEPSILIKLNILNIITQN